MAFIKTKSLSVWTTMGSSKSVSSPQADSGNRRNRNMSRQVVVTPWWKQSSRTRYMASQTSLCRSLNSANYLESLSLASLAA